jgi:hypothetical protein
MFGNRQFFLLLDIPFFGNAGPFGHPTFESVRPGMSDDPGLRADNAHREHCQATEGTASRACHDVIESTHGLVLLSQQCSAIRSPHVSINRVDSALMTADRRIQEHQ